jgi:hypothetical protein
VHIEEVKGKAVGSDKNAVAEWRQTKKFDKVASQPMHGLVQKDLLLD